MNSPNCSIQSFTPEQLLVDLQEDRAFAVNISQDWYAALSRMPEQLAPQLTAASIRENSSWGNLEPEVTAALENLALHCWNERALRVWLWYCVYRLNNLEAPHYFNPQLTLKKYLGDNSGLFYLLVATTMVPLAVANYRKQGIDDMTIRHTMQQLRCYCNNHRAGCNGLPGLLIPQLGWLRHYRDGEILRAG